MAKTYDEDVRISFAFDDAPYEQQVQGLNNMFGKLGKSISNTLNNSGTSDKHSFITMNYFGRL